MPVCNHRFRRTCRCIRDDVHSQPVCLQVLTLRDVRVHAHVPHVGERQQQVHDRLHVTLAPMSHDEFGQSFGCWRSQARRTGRPLHGVCPRPPESRATARAPVSARLRSSGSAACASSWFLSSVVNIMGLRPRRIAVRHGLDTITDAAQRAAQCQRRVLHASRHHRTGVRALRSESLRRQDHLLSMRQPMQHVRKIPARPSRDAGLVETHRLLLGEPAVQPVRHRILSLPDAVGCHPSAGARHAGRMGGPHAGQHALATGWRRRLAVSRMLPAAGTKRT